MEFLPEQRRFPEIKEGDDVIAYLNRKLRWELENWRLIASRVNFLLERVNVTLDVSEDGARYMKVEFIPSGKTRNDNGNWRFLLMPDDVKLQMKREGTWTDSDSWHG